jgi:hypothetical protein
MGKASRRKANARREVAEYERDMAKARGDADDALSRGCGRCGGPVSVEAGSSYWMDRFWCRDCEPDYDICGCCQSLAGFSRQKGNLGPRKEVAGWRDHNGVYEPGFDEWLAWFETWKPPSVLA